MKTNIITKQNFDKAHLTTIDSEITDRGTFYLDAHILNGSKHFTVSKDETIMDCYNDESEAKDRFYGLIEADTSTGLREQQ